MNHPTAYSHLAGREVSTWSEGWRHECEVAAVPAMSPAQQRSFFEGATDPATGRKERGVADLRGTASAERIRPDMMGLADIRREGGR